MPWGALGYSAPEGTMGGPWGSQGKRGGALAADFLFSVLRTFVQVEERNGAAPPPVMIRKRIPRQTQGLAA